jgi:hypothetical protein
MHVEHRERKGERKAGGDLVGKGERAQDLLHRATLCLGLGEQRRNGVSAAVAGGVAEALVELAPRDRHAVRAGGGITIDARRALREHRRLFRARCRTRQALARARDLRLERPGDDGADVIGQDRRSAAAHGLRQRPGEGLGRPADEFLRIRGRFASRRIVVVRHDRFAPMVGRRGRRKML